MKLLAMIQLSERDKTWERVISDLGGREHVIRDISLTQKAAALLESDGATSEITKRKPGPSALNGGKPGMLVEGRHSISQEELLELQQPPGIYP